MNRNFSRTRGAPEWAGVVVTLAVVVTMLASPPHRAHAAATETKRLTLDRYGITVDYRSSDERVAEAVASIVEQRIPELARELGLAAVRPFGIVLIPDIEEYEEHMGFTLPPWGIAFAFAENGIVLVDVQRATNAWNSLDKVIPHEFSHMLLAQRVPGVRVPLWFVEGLAQWQAREWSVLESWRLMESVWTDDAPHLEHLTSSLPADERRVRQAYRVAYAAFQERFDKRMDRIPGFLDELARQGDFGKAFRAYWNEDEYEYYARFALHLESQYKRGLMLFQTGPLFTLVSVLFVLVIVTRWLKNRRKLKRMEEAEREWPTPGGL